MRKAIHNYLALPALLFVLSGPALAAQEVPVPQISVTGTPDFLTENILAHLTIGNESCNLSQARLQRFRRPVNQAVLSAANALGYYHLTHSLEFSTEDGCWSLLITADPGPRVTLENIQVDITGDMPTSARREFDLAVAENSPARGEFLDHGQYEKLKSTLSAVAVENGFYASRIEQSEVSVDSIRNTADIDLSISVGPQYFFGEILIDNGTRLHEDFIYRLIPVQSGEPFTSDAMLQLNTTLADSSYFQSVSLDPGIRRAVDNQVPVTVSLKPRPRRAWSTGIGFTTDTGPRIRLSFEDRFVNSIGHQFDSEISVSEVRSEADFTYRIPLRNPARQQISLRGGMLHENNDSYISDRMTLETAYEIKLNSGWQLSYFVNFQDDRYQISDRSDTSTLIMPGINLTRTRADDPVFPSRGWKLFTQIQGAGDSMLSDTSFIQGNFSYKQILSAGNFRLIAATQLGITAVDDITDLPASIRFFTGGDQSVRGYKFRSLGPMDDLGEVIGGKHLIITSLETDFRVTGNWRGALFVDHGNAFNDLSNMKLKTSVGFGIRWLSPIGPLRFDLARPLDDGGVRFHITMGPDL